MLVAAAVLCYGVPDRKAPGELPRRGSSAQVITRASGNDVAVDTDAKSVVVLVREAVERGRLGGAGQLCVGHNRSARCRLQLRIDHVEAHIEPRREVVLATGTDAPLGPVVAAGPDTRGAREARRSERNRASKKVGLRTAERQVGGVAVPLGYPPAIGRCPQLRRPQVVVGRVDAIGRRQLDVTGDGAEHAVGGEAEAEAVTVPLVEASKRVRLGVGDIAAGTLRVVHLELEVVAALSVQLGAAAYCPAQLVGRMAANLRAGDRADRIC